MTVIVNDRALEKTIRADRERTGASRFDEVWEGTYVVSPLANEQHQWLIMGLCLALADVIDTTRGDRVYPGVNVSDRTKGWKRNYRVPDVAVVLATNPCRQFDAVMVGGPDMIFEVVSRDDMAREKLGFYAKVGVREVVLIDRDPWGLELFRLADGELRGAGVVAADSSDSLASEVLPLSFGLVPGENRPRIVVQRLDREQEWVF
ncbi:MAG: Uma2 family endonuclease [Isosphaeraceae bacterium]